ncbi:MAG: hypothetical protein K6A96_12230 [Prevotella sp.]|nr:hypothetical protein [Prevotella sp.]
MKKALLLMALFAGSLLSANAQTATADRTLTAFVKPGETQWLAIQLNNGSDKYVAFQLDVKLPTNLTYAGSVQLLRKGETAPHEVYSNQLADGTLKIASFSYKEGTTKKGNDVFTGEKGDLLLIKVTASGNYVAKNVQVGEAKFVKNDANFTEVPLTAYVAGLLGDVNADDIIDAQDASLILQNSVGKIADDATGYEVIVADVNEADGVDAQDASLVLQYSVKKISSLGNVSNE